MSLGRERYIGTRERPGSVVLMGVKPAETSGQEDVHWEGGRVSLILSWLRRGQRTRLGISANRPSDGFAESSSVIRVSRMYSQVALMHKILQLLQGRGARA